MCEKHSEKHFIRHCWCCSLSNCLLCRGHRHRIHSKDPNSQDNIVLAIRCAVGQHGPPAHRSHFRRFIRVHADLWERESLFRRDHRPLCDKLYFGVVKQPFHMGATHYNNRCSHCCEHLLHSNARRFLAFAFKFRPLLMVAHGRRVLFTYCPDQCHRLWRTGCPCPAASQHFAAKHLFSTIY